MFYISLDSSASGRVRTRDGQYIGYFSHYVGRVMFSSIYNIKLLALFLKLSPMRSVFIFTLFCLLPGPVCAEITAEGVLGEYWNDPLFGEAATNQTIFLDVLHGRIWPESLSFEEGARVRVVVRNKTDQPHMLVFSKELERVKSSSDLEAQVLDELYHARKSRAQSGGHSHAHSNKNVSETEAIIKSIDQNPTVFVPVHDKKEILISFDQKGNAYFSCVVQGHDGESNTGLINIE